MQRLHASVGVHASPYHHHPYRFHRLITYHHRDQVAWQDRLYITDPPSLAAHSLGDLVLKGMASASAALSIRDGRVRFSELSTIESLSLYWSHVNQLAATDISRPLLVLEQDAVPLHQFDDCLAKLTQPQALSRFEVAVFSPSALFLEPHRKKGLVKFDPFTQQGPLSSFVEPLFFGTGHEIVTGRLRPNASFFGTHAVLYSATG